MKPHQPSSTCNLEEGSRPPRVFLGGPFSTALRSEVSGKLKFHDLQLRSKIEAAITAIRSTGVEVSNSHLEDGWGEIDFGSNFAVRDFSLIEKCDSFVAILPVDANQNPYRTDGTFIEIGYAVAAGKDVLLILDEPESPGWSLFLKDLIHSPKVRLATFSKLIETPLPLILGAFGFDNKPIPRQSVTDVRLWKWLQCSLTIPVPVRVGRANLIVHPGVMNPLFSHSPDFLMSFWQIRPGDRVLDIGCGCGVVGINALLGGAAELLSVDLNSVAVENTKENLKRNNVSHLGTATVSNVFSAVSGQFDVILFNPPYWGDHEPKSYLDRAAFDSPSHTFLCAVLSDLKEHLKPDGRCFIAFSDQGDLSLLVQKVEDANLRIRALHIQRPDKLGFHVRVGFEISRK